MERRKLLDSLRTLVKRLNELSPKLNLLEASVLNCPGLPMHQWQGKLRIFIRAIDENINEKKPQSDRDVLVADVKVLAADVEEILNEIAGTQTFEEPSKNCFPFSTSRKRKAVLTVNDDLRTKIFRTSSQMATLNDRRCEIGLLVRSTGWAYSGPRNNNDSLHIEGSPFCTRFLKKKVRAPNEQPPTPEQEQPPPAQEHEAQVEIPPVQACNDREPSSRPEKRRRLDEDSEGTIQGQVSNNTSFMSEPLSGTRRIKTDSNPKILDSEDDIEIS
ncbi:uncharacterized protein LOC123217551 [Mangifera indica]|uniref:uncharacterized protein LOC123217551 n=1 Tax=Mangifera indica TaxID=29780 RepID=UPI001CFC2249|nr:uncharacterized protein LOC123217551 [Mangifera indica]